MVKNLNTYCHNIFELGRYMANPIDSKTVDIGLPDCVIRIYFPPDPQAEIMLKALAHLQLNQPYTGPLGGEIVWLDSSIYGNEIESAPFSEEDYTGYGHVAYKKTEWYQLTDHLLPRMSMIYYDLENFGVLITNSIESLNIYIKGAPFVSLIQWITRKFEWSVAHAASIGLHGKGVLLVGNSGAGKSTTALSALLSKKLDYLCDDKCLVRLNPEPEVLCIYNSVKINQDVMDRFPFFNSMMVETDLLGKKGKGLAFLHPDFENQMAVNLQLKSILIPRISDSKEPRLIPTSSANAFRVMAPSTFLFLPGSGSIDLKLMSDLLSLLPCYYIELSPDLQANIDVIYKHILTFSLDLE